MHAWRARDHGPVAAVLELVADDPPEPGPGQVALAVDACGLNYADTLLCLGTYQDRPGLPFTPGIEVAGTIQALGPGAADRWALGDRVVGSPALPHGGLAEVCLAGVDSVFAVPPGVSSVDAAATYVAGQTAWFALAHRARLAPGEVLLVHAGAGGVGSAAIQLGVALGARVVATAGGPTKVARCRDLGADVVLDHRTDDVVAEVRAATDGRGADVVFDPVGGDTFTASASCVAWEGRIVVIGAASGRYAHAPTNHVMVKNYDVIGLNWGGYRRWRPDLVRRAHREVAAELAAGRFRPQVSEVVSLADAVDALVRLEQGRTTGKIVVEPASGRAAAPEADARAQPT